MCSRFQRRWTRLWLTLQSRATMHGGCDPLRTVDVAEQEDASPAINELHLLNKAMCNAVCCEPDQEPDKRDALKSCLAPNADVLP